MKKLIRNLSCAPMVIMAATIPALAQTVVSSPANGQQVPSPFTLNMSASTCASRPVSAVGYSLDNSGTSSVWPVQYINGPVAAPSGWHTLHVKVWNLTGQVCVTDVSINVNNTPQSNTSSSVIPANAVKISSIQALGNWTGIHDVGTPGSSSGTMSLAGSPSLTGTARLFANQFNFYGGQRYSVQFDDNTTSQNFFYDTWVYIAGSSKGFSNLEFDLAQTMPNGQTVIMGFQCDNWFQRWDYTVNAGSPTNPYDTWLHSNAPCNLNQWRANQWHHVQIYFSHNNSGWVTYHSVWLDGAEQVLNSTVFSGFALGWDPVVLTNFQIDGNSPGTTWGNVYLDEMTVYRW